MEATKQKLNLSAKCVLFALKTLDDLGKLPGEVMNREIMKISGVSRNSVHRAILELTKAGFIEVDRKLNCRLSIHMTKAGREEIGGL